MNTQTVMKSLVLALSICAITGCAMPELVKETPDGGGRIVIHGSKSLAGKQGEEKAKAMMASRCPAGYNITEKGQVATSQLNMGYSMTPVTDLYLEFKCK